MSFAKKKPKEKPPKNKLIHNPKVAYRGRVREKAL